MSVQDSSKNFSSISNPGDKPNANGDKNSKYRKGYERTVQNYSTHVNEKTAFKAKSIRTVVPIVLGFSCKSDLNEQHDQCHKSKMQTRNSSVTQILSQKDQTQTAMTPIHQP